ncbi:MAG: LysR family transcriptional regulator [Sneathiella sp.]|jgi:DNA-binding transcriptional LysR family regulator|uniref:LysR family transcriptional regulator n=1 Tax=Sneathiella sp. TaxID=1964365 RepID=UPI000C36105D|nr:LysR family transcriptional regulator [Sneathiella sp.]MAL79821.1 LysR family transcriptional regulator [Sneathiella sp.]
MDIYQLRYFLAIVETGNFSRAAERSFVSQPTLSTGIKKLEAELGTTLFSREARKISLTEAGRRLLPHARTIIYECNAAKSEVSRRSPLRRLQLGLLRTAPTQRISALVNDFAKAHGDIQISIKEGAAAQLQRWLDEGRVNVALSIRPETESGLSFARLYRWKYMLAIPTSHSFASRSLIPLAELDRLDFLHRTHCEAESELTRAFANAGVSPNIVFRTDQDDKALALVSAGLGLCMMPDILSAPGIALLPVDGINIGRSIGLLWRKTEENDLIRSFQMFATSHGWYPERSGNKNLAWAR